MENEVENKNSNFSDKLKDFIKKNTKIFYTLIFITIILAIILTYYNHRIDKKNEIISEKYIQAGIHFSLNKEETARKIYEEIILSKNQFYSALALNNIIDNNLEKDNEKILNFFKIVENIKMDEDKLDLIKIKKALYLKKILKNNEGNKLLEEIISKNSTWKDAAKELLK